MRLSLQATLERWPLREPFTIARLTFHDSLIATVRVRDEDGHEGVGECEPHEWDEAQALALLRGAGVEPGAWREPPWLGGGLDRAALQSTLPRSPLRNAVDCALWDLESKRAGVRAAELAGGGWEPVAVMPTIGIEAPSRMAETARGFGPVPLIKVKLGAKDALDGERMEAVAAANPDASLLIDVNTGWSPETLERMLPLARRCRVRVIEQPLPPELDERMPPAPDGIFFCADESCLDRTSLPRVAPRFQAINIKLDKAGGLTEALALRAEAERRGMQVMVGMMSGTSLAVAPASILAQGLTLVDLEVGFLVRDRTPALRIEHSRLQPPEPALWG